MSANGYGLGGNYGTENSLRNSGGGQDFDQGEFNTGAKVAKGAWTPCCANNGTKDTLNNSGAGKQNFGRARFNTGARFD